MFPAGEERVALRRERIGQRFFRAAVMSAYDGRCCITGLSILPCWKRVISCRGGWMRISGRILVMDCCCLPYITRRLTVG